ncbi:MAG: glycosyltransferase [Rhodovibrionaceae bacterium]
MAGPLPRVSLLMPCRNGGAHLSAALDSLLAQDYPDLEILICDDASDDGSAELLAARLADYSGPHAVRLLRNETRQGIETYNRLVEAASGAFMVIAHADDISYPQRVARLVEVWRNSGVSLVASNALAIDGAGREIGLYRRETGQPDFRLERLAETGWQAALLGATLAWEPEVFRRFGPIKAQDSAISSDWILPFRAALLKGIRYIEEPLLAWRYHDASRSRQMLDQHRDGRAAKEAATANALIQTVYLIDTLNGFAGEAPEEERSRLARVRAILQERLLRLARDWAQIRNALMHERLRPRWEPPESG